ncbi:MAG: hypothetical protein AAF645_18170, partial [Myxococcota bacterium]
ASCMLAGCFGSSTSSPVGIDAAVSVNDASISTDAAPTQCETWCLSRAIDEDPAVPPTPCLSRQDCLVECEATLAVAPDEDVQFCIEEDALCFISLEDCALDTFGFRR